MFSRLLDMNETRNERKAALSGGSFPRLFSDDEQDLRWSHYKNLGADAMLPIVRDRVFPHFKNTAVDGLPLANMKDAVDDPKSLACSVGCWEIDDLPLGEMLRVTSMNIFLARTPPVLMAIPYTTSYYPIDGGFAEPKPNETIGDPQLVQLASLSMLLNI